ncbi:MAG: C40 family peptidase [Bacteroidales bacterium]|nr:C40 family peptidase [Bacteroidales bacterium]
MLPAVPLRKDPDHKSEQLSQVLFGETLIIKDEYKNWYRIIADFDNYAGWLEKRSVQELTAATEKKIIVNKPIIEIEQGGNRFFIPAGSEISKPDSDNAFNINSKTFKIKSHYEADIKQSLAETGLAFMNSPYLWGGRTALGIDCSGLTQTVYKIHGHTIPRDAIQQANTGKEINSLSNAVEGDLLFFYSDTKNISHAGIYLGNNTIIHASISVHIDKIDEKGIFSSDLNKYTHYLSKITRMI